MIISIRVNNSFVFSEGTELSLKADMRQKKFMYNVHSEKNFNVLKSLGIYGPNNVGKTCLLKCIRNIKDVLINKKINVRSNIFNKSEISELGVTFLENSRKYSFDFKYDTKNKEFIYEKFSELITDQHGNEREEIKLLKDTEKKEYFFENKSIEDLMKLTSKNNILIHLIDATEFESFESIKNTLITFANRIEVVDMNNIPMEKTITLLKSRNKTQEKIVNFIKNADLDMENFQYLGETELNLKLSQNAGEKAEEKALDIPEQIMDQIRLTSVYKGIPVPSMIFDSTGTKKIAALASYIIEALEKGKILVVDEIDSSIHFKLTRAIVSMFNNELNTKAQLIFSVHDINLMDCKKLFRKEQIWFIDKDDEGVYLYSLADFTANDDGVRDTTNIIEKYKKGLLGALPDPELINTLLEVEHE
ncbi:ATP-binding protein [Clostridium sp. CM027]|uniref:AAA family ATPase n=1 Tax=Clostridium sp. CM027 TaxID=2849865 RepID=UPI001C6F4AD4|nr:ATP-binding protein [Clostridium sp. CM027]MBW9146567.1 ATP-binding protein [Clostridium sp. CM027]UVE42251.1 ATP-binding protein [Clostridium sp. CM027]